ncbi:DMT family transporter [Oceanibium sediminis]|uniref:DMT family transporter n=1 Tax=Oceanibium sediminis TaxID=2026339 RepID=UPI000DD350F0|nr:DMT family transporter [Oceanibium sediminis]
MELRIALVGLGFVVIWSSAFTAARIAVVDAPPFLFLAIRFAVAGILAVGAAWLMGQRLTLDRRGWLSVALFGVFQNTLYLGLIFTAVQRIEASIAVIIASCLPLVVAAARWILFAERLRPLGIAGLVAGLAGVLVIMSARITGGADPLGILLCVGGLLSLATATLLMGRASAGGNLLMVVGLQMFAGSLTLLPLSAIFETWEITFTPSLGLAFVYIVLFPGLLATLIWFHLVERIGATRASSFHFLNPFFGVAIAALILGEALTLRDLLGVGVIMAGIWGVQRGKA